MSDLKGFLKGNKIKKENVTVAVSKSFVDENGKPLKWTIKPISSAERDKIRDMCMKQVPINGKKNKFTQEVDVSKFTNKLIVASIVEPNLNSKELQDSYGVMSAEELIREMIDSPGEYDNLFEFISEFNDWDKTIEDEVEEAKN